MSEFYHLSAAAFVCVIHALETPFGMTLYNVVSILGRDP
jgi:hypothetical protein